MRCITVRTVGWTWCDWSRIFRTLSSWRALALLFGSFIPCNSVPVIYNVLLNLHALSCRVIENSLQNWWSQSCISYTGVANTQPHFIDGRSADSILSAWCAQQLMTCLVIVRNILPLTSWINLSHPPTLPRTVCFLKNLTSHSPWGCIYNLPL